MTPKISPRTLGRLQRLSLPLRSVGIPLVVGVLVAVPVLAREAQSLPPYAAKAGEAATVVVRVVETRLRDSEVQAEFERTARYDTDVLSISADGMRVRWVLKDYGHAIKADVSGRQANGLAALDTVNAALKGRIIEFDADPNGALLRVRDWDAQKAAIADAMRPALEAVLATAIKAQAATLSAEQIAAKAKERAIDLVSQTILVHTDVTAVAIFQDGALPALVQGRKVAIGTPASGADAAPVLSADADLPRKSNLTLERINTTGGEAYVTWTTTFDEAGLKAKAMAGMRARLTAALAAANTGSTAIQDDVLAKFTAQLAKTAMSRTENGSANVALANGWTRNVSYQTKTSITQLDGSREIRVRNLNVAVSPR